MQYNMHPANMYLGTSPHYAYSQPTYPLVAPSPYLTPQQHLLNQYHTMLAQQQRMQSTAPTVLVSPTTQGARQPAQLSTDTNGGAGKRRHSDAFNGADNSAAGSAQTLSSLLAAACMPELAMQPMMAHWPHSTMEMTAQPRVNKVPRRRNYELPESQRWYCPYQCGRWYRNTSSISRTNHIKKCPKVPKAIQDAAIAADQKNKQSKAAAATPSPQKRWYSK